MDCMDAVILHIALTAIDVRAVMGFRLPIQRAKTRDGVKIAYFRRATGYFRKFPVRIQSRAVSMGCVSICRMRAPIYWICLRRAPWLLILSANSMTVWSSSGSPMVSSWLKGRATNCSPRICRARSSFFFGFCFIIRIHFTGFPLPVYLAVA